MRPPDPPAAERRRRCFRHCARRLCSGGWSGSGPRSSGRGDLQRSFRTWCASRPSRIQMRTMCSMSVSVEPASMSSTSHTPWAHIETADGRSCSHTTQRLSQSPGVRLSPRSSRLWSSRKAGGASSGGSRSASKLLTSEAHHPASSWWTSKRMMRGPSTGVPRTWPGFRCAGRPSCDPDHAAGPGGRAPRSGSPPPDARTGCTVPSTRARSTMSGFDCSTRASPTVASHFCQSNIWVRTNSSSPMGRRGPSVHGTVTMSPPPTSWPHRPRPSSRRPLPPTERTRSAGPHRRAVGTPGPCVPPDQR